MVFTRGVGPYHHYQCCQLIEILSTTLDDKNFIQQNQTLFYCFKNFLNFEIYRDIISIFYGCCRLFDELQYIWIAMQCNKYCNILRNEMNFY